MDLEELIHSIDIVEYIGQFVDLEQKGQEFWSLSPFKSEKTPSFSVRRDPPFFYDFSSGASGNVYHFVKRYFNCTGREAVDILKAYAGVDGEIEAPAEKMEATKVAKRFLPPKTTQKPSAGTVLPDDYMERFEKRPEKLAVWEAEGISGEVLDRFEVRYDAFSDRLVYPIRNLAGKIVNVGGRTLDPRWKEKGLRKYTYLYHWGTMDVIYGLYDNFHSISSKREIVLFEGAKSVMLAATWGIFNTGAILTSHLNPNQLKILAHLGGTVVFGLDKDVDIRQDRNIQKLAHYVRVQYLADKDGLLGEKDAPVDRGEEVFQKLYDNRQYYRHMV